LAGEPFPGLTRNDPNGAPGRLNLQKGRSEAEDRRERIFWTRQRHGRGAPPFFWRRGEKIRRRRFRADRTAFSFARQ